jgi:hypothetical protein
MRLTRRHIRAALIWTGLALGAFALLAYAASFFCNLYYNEGTRIVHFGRGAMSIQWQGESGAAILSPGTPEGWNIERAGSRRWRWQPRSTDPAIDATNRRAFAPGLFVIPYWIPLAIGFAALVALLPPGAPPLPKPNCPACRFDLSGAPIVESRRVHVRCPECGTISPREDTRPAVPAPT